MARTHKSYRLEAATVEAIEAYAEAHGITNSEALAALVAAGSAEREDARPERAERGGGSGAAGHVADLRAEIATLTAQLAEKDRQISGLMAIADQAQRLQAAEATRALAEARTDAEAAPAAYQGHATAPERGEDGEEDAGPADGAQTAPQEAETWGARLKRWLMGE